MRAESVDFLREYLNTPSPTSFEGPGQRVWCEYARQFTDEVTSDAYGNCRAVINPGKGPRIVLDGHGDEVGMMVKHITDEGFLRIQFMGQVDAVRMPGQRVEIHTEKGSVLGVVCLIPMHIARQLAKDKDKKKDEEMAVHDLAIDIGAKDGKEAKKRVSVGDPAVIAVEFQMLTDDVFTARGCDDRLGTFTAIETVRLLSERRDELDCCVIAHSSVQEEVGILGAYMAAHTLDADAVIAIEVAIATDIPGVDFARFGEVKVGSGPEIHTGRENHPVLVERLQVAAKARKVPLQINPFLEEHCTDASSYYMQMGGIPSALVSVPTRYIHSPISTARLSDVDHSVAMLETFCLNIKKDDVFRVKI
ncbi:MAG: zinc-binding metallopeptidase family protein [Planctomycetota bacterium]|jgi:endoglucanase